MNLDEIETEELIRLQLVYNNRMLQATNPMWTRHYKYWRDETEAEILKRQEESNADTH